MKLISLELNGFKSFGKKSSLTFRDPITAVVGPNGSGKSNVVEGIRFALGEQSMKSLRGKSGSDLIFAGSKMTPKGTRAKVSLTFDNKDKVFKIPSIRETLNLDFDEVTVTREVASDGSNTYSINGMEVRLKDVHELLASIHIGASSHHIISQGEADRLLSSSARDRREMIEDALGLKIYQYRLKESERKLDKAEIHLKEVALLRRELAPHLNFLKKQVDKIEKARELRDDLIARYAIYLAREALYIENEQKDIETKKDLLVRDIHTVDEKLQEYSRPVSNPILQKLSDDRSSSEKEIIILQSTISDTERALGRLEGRLEALRAQHDPVEGHKKHSTHVPRTYVEKTFSDLREIFSSVHRSSDIGVIKNLIQNAVTIIDSFTEEKETVIVSNVSNNEAELEEIEKIFSETLATLSHLREQEKDLNAKIATIRESIDAEKSKDQNRDRLFYELKNNREHMASEESLLRMREESFSLLKTRFEEEIREGSILIGPDILEYKNTPRESLGEEDRSAQEEQRRAIERIKIKLEEAGGGGADIMQEFEETKNRDEFLAREILDAEKSRQSLYEIIHDLRITLDTEFRSGIQKINEQFQNFFSLMFGGGNAFLSLVAMDKKKVRAGEDDESDISMDEDEGIDHGVEITVSLPRKKVKELQMLSGGERSLTSIALLFAISQVNPPPFLVLDETDAALDEANSKKYGDMLEHLAQYSQLIVVTHNRETMSRAQTLYGVTVGAEGTSKLLSVKFEDATVFAK